MLFDGSFSSSWKPTWPEKPPKRVPGGDYTLLLFSGLEGSWRGLGGVLGSLAAQEPISIDFQLIFDGF